MVIVCIGDSITYGQLLENPELAWPHLLKGYTVQAAGVPGDTTRLGLERFPKDVQESGANTVIIQFGHNDCNRWLSDQGLPRVSRGAFEANIFEMLERCWAFKMTPFLCTLTPSHRSPNYAEDVTIYNNILRRVAHRESVPVIDVRKSFIGPDLLHEDGLHLSEQGHRVYASEVQATLDTWFEDR